jgi:broad specificity phosphatase PhoE
MPADSPARTAWARRSDASGMERRLLLVKHAAPAIEPEVPAARWRLSDAGRATCIPLADRLAAYAPAAIVASVEPKAAETGQILADRLGLPFETGPDLHEHDRAGVPFLGADAWREAVGRFFANPKALVLGRETARAAEDRFARAVANVLDRHPIGNPAIVAHGTVIGLFVARHNAIDPFSLWKQLGLPSFAVVRLPGFGLAEVVSEIA